MKESEQEGEEGFDAEAVYSNCNDVSLFSLFCGLRADMAAAQDIDDATRTAISRVSNIIRVLAAHYHPLTDAVLLEAYEWAVEQECGVKDLLQEDVGPAMIAAVSAHS